MSPELKKRLPLIIAGIVTFVVFSAVSIFAKASPRVSRYFQYRSRKGLILPNIPARPW